MTTRHEYLERFVARLTDELLITSVGATARELQAQAPREGSLYRVHLGGAVSMVVAAQEPMVEAVVGEAGFSSYRSAARHVMGQAILL